MTDTEIRVAIAEQCGWKKHGVSPWWFRPDGKLHNSSELPDYPNDLNAMHEIERVDDWKYWRTLQDVVHGKVMYSGDLSCEAWAKVAHAAARQRALAFIKTLGLDSNESKNR